MRCFARVLRGKLPAPLSGLAALVPAALAPPSGSVEIVSLGKIWGVAVVLWGACALLFGVLAMLRTPWTDETITHLQTRIRRHRRARAASAARPSA